MISEYRKFFYKIKNDDTIDNKVKYELLEYIGNNLFSKVRTFSPEDYEKLEKILKEINYDLSLFSKLLDTSNKIKNAINDKNKKNYNNTPNVDYVEAVYRMFKELNMDLLGYNLDNSYDNVTLARGVYKIIYEKELIDGENSFIQIAKNIYDTYYGYGDVNKSICMILKILNNVEKGLYDLKVDHKLVFSSKEFYSIFETGENIGDLYFSNIIKEFYPLYGNSLFSLIKKIIENNKSQYLDAEYIMKSLRTIQEKKDVFNSKKEKAISDILKIDLDVKRKTVEVFEELIRKIEENSDISKDVKTRIISNISDSFDDFSRKQVFFVDDKMKKFFDNCLDYINELVIPGANSKSGIDELIGELLGECKNFFVEYDSKKFREIVEYITDNTTLSMDDLKVLGRKCSQFFKDADTEKLKVINEQLIGFKKYLDRSFRNNEFANVNLFDSILHNNPQLLLKENDIQGVLGFLKGEKSLDDYGYKGPAIKLKKDFLSYNFYKKIASEDFKLLFETNMALFIDNFNYLESICSNCGINFRKLNINEDMIFTLLSNDLNKEIDNTFMSLKMFFASKEVKVLLESNPELLMMKKADLGIIFERCILNENDSCGYYDLFVSELLRYNKDTFRNKSREELLAEEFVYIESNIDTSREIDVLEIITSDVIELNNSDKLWEQYEEFSNNKSELNELINELENENLDIQDFIMKANRTLDIYASTHSKVPNVMLKNRIIEVISGKKVLYEYKLSEGNEAIDEKKGAISMYEKENRDGGIVSRELAKVLDKISDGVIKDSVQRFIDQDIGKRIIANNEKIAAILKELDSILGTVKKLDNEVEKLNYLLMAADFKTSAEEIDGEYVVKKSFTIDKLVNDVTDKRSIEEQIDEALNGENLIIFSDSVDLEDIPNDRNFIEKIHKFLGNTEFSILSQKFMKDNTTNKDVIEKYYDQRDNVWARRENRTPVRVYYIPVHTKYFTCYYVINVNYKDHIHMDAGCSSDDVYKRKIIEAKDLENRINSLSEEEIICFIKEAKKEYKNEMSPIVTKIESYDKKRKGKK